jgi:hypothetical protein
MKTAEILRKLADLVDTVESDANPPSEENTPDELGTMVPPLQQKIEILKKSQGIDNIYDEQADELDTVKRNAGLAVITTAEEDEPFDG